MLRFQKFLPWIARISWVRKIYHSYISNIILHRILERLKVLLLHPQYNVYTLYKLKDLSSHLHWHEYACFLTSLTENKVDFLAKNKHTKHCIVLGVSLHTSKFQKFAWILRIAIMNQWTFMKNVFIYFSWLLNFKFSTMLISLR